MTAAAMLLSAQAGLLHAAIAAVLDVGAGTESLALEVACGVDTHDQWLTMDGRRVYHTWIDLSADQCLVKGEWL